jgi:hypothetical protein
VGWVVLAGLAVLLPALVRGSELGSYDMLGLYGLTTHPGTVHNIGAGDLISEMIPWSSLAWSQVHAGHLPLWNSYSALGMPLAFNWQSSAFSVPSLLGYLFPANLAYTVQVLATVWIAGAGAYVLCRVLGLGVLASAFAGVAFELGGPFLYWLGWPISSVISWTGWILAGCVLIQRGRRRALWVVLTGGAFACAVYAGQPDALIILVGMIAVVQVVVWIRETMLEPDRRPPVRAVVDTALAFGLGLLLAAPLLLPGLQLISGSARASQGRAAVLAQPAPPLSILGYNFLQGLADSQILYGFAYVGVVAVVCAIGAVIVRRREPYVAGLAVACVVGLLVAFLNPLEHVVNALPAMHSVRLPRAVAFTAFGAAVLGGIGVQALTTCTRAVVPRVFGVLFAVFGTSLVLVRVTGVYRSAPQAAYLRTGSFAWAAGGILMGLAVVLLLGTARPDDAPAAATTGGRGAGRPPHHPRRLSVGAAAVLLVFQTVFLVVVGSGVWPSASDGIPVSPAARTLQRTVGASLVGLGSPACYLSAGLGILPNANILYGVHQLAAYDPLLPSRYYSSWTALTGRSAGYPSYARYCPGVTSASLARLYGVSYVLEPSGAPGPTGATYVETLDDEALFHVTGSASATMTPLTPGAGIPGVSAVGTPVAVAHPDPATWRIESRSTAPQLLRLRLTDVPGWHATIDGRPLALRPFAGIMMQAVIPPGRHVVEVGYWPSRFTAGLVLAALGLVCALVALAAGPVRRWTVRSGRRDPAEPGPAPGQGVRDQIGSVRRSAAPGSGPPAR